MEKLILASQKKAVFDLLKASMLEPSNFEWTVERSKFAPHQPISCVRYKGTEYYLKFDFYQDRHFYIYSPGKDKLVQENYPGNWAIGWKYVTEWCFNLKREIETTDPWEEIEKYIPSENINLEDEESNSPFSYAQVEHIKKALNELRSQIKQNYNLKDDKIISVDNRLDYLIDRVEKLGRIDWKNIFVSSIIAIAYDLTLNPEKTSMLWTLVKNCFRGILLLGGK